MPKGSALIGPQARRYTVFPADGNEADRDGVEEFADVGAVGDGGNGVDVGGELDALVEVGTGGGMGTRGARPSPYLGDEGSAQGEDDVAVLEGVLEDGVALVGVELPAGGGDCGLRYLTSSKAKPLRYSVSGIMGMMGWSGAWEKVATRRRMRRAS